MKLLLILFFIIFSLQAQTKKIYYYSNENDIESFKDLKKSFDTYLKKFGDYEFQPFTSDKLIQNYISYDDSIVILSSWVYKNMIKKRILNPKLVAVKDGNNNFQKFLIGKPYNNIDGMVTSTYSNNYLIKSLNNIDIQTNTIKPQKVLKQQDALMSVGFDMSKFAFVTEDSFNFLKEDNTNLANKLSIYKKTPPSLRFIVSTNIKLDDSNDYLKIFTSMKNDEDGLKVLDILGIDEIRKLDIDDIRVLHGSNK